MSDFSEAEKDAASWADVSVDLTLFIAEDDKLADAVEKLRDERFKFVRMPRGLAIWFLTEGARRR